MKNFDWKKHAPLIAAIVLAIVCLIFDQPVPAVVILAAYFVFRRFQKKKEAPKQQNGIQYVWISKGGSHYHYSPACQSLKGVTPVKIPLSKAKRQGMTVCGHCNKF